MHFRLEGNEPSQDVIVAIRKLAQLADLPNEGRMLVDRRKNQATYTAQELRDIINEHSKLAECLNGPVAIVARRSVHFGMARQATLIAKAQGFRMEAFTSMKEAAAWLGIARIPDEEAWSLIS